MYRRLFHRHLFFLGTTAPLGRFQQHFGLRPTFFRSGNMAVRLFSRSHRVTPESPLVIEQRKVNVRVTTRRVARAIASASSRKAAREAAGRPAEATTEIPVHLLRHAHPALPPLIRAIMGLVLVPVDPNCCSTPPPSSSSAPNLKLLGHAQNIKAMEAAAAPAEVWRVGTPEDDEETADLRRRRIYALNQLLCEQHQSQWRAYRHRRSQQMRALSKCAENGSVNVSRLGLRRFADSCARMRDDERLAAEEAQRQLEEDQRREAEKLARCAALASKQHDDEAAMQANEECILAMPFDPASEGGKARYCPWFSTADGCPMTSCPLSHASLPVRLVTYKYRLWAFETAERGWAGEPMNGPSKE